MVTTPNKVDDLINRKRKLRKPRKSRFNGNSPWWMQVLLWLLYLGTVGLLIWAAKHNIEPFILMVKSFGGGDGPSMLQSIPRDWHLVFAVVWLFVRFGTKFIGTILWSITQFLEVLPVLMLFDKPSMVIAMDEAKKDQKFQVDDNDGPIQEWVKGFYNNLPMVFFRNALFISLVAYGFDFVMNLAIYPLASSNPIIALFVGNISAFQPANGVRIVVNLFMFEFALILVFTFGQWLGYQQRAKADG